MKYNNTILFFLPVIFLSCATTKSMNIDNISNNNNEPIINYKDVYIDAQKVVFIDKPYFVVLDKKEYDSLDDNTKNEMKNYFANNDTIYYNYFNTIQYYVFTKVGFVTDIILDAGETITGDVIISDNVRFLVNSTFHIENNTNVIHINIKPISPNIEANMIVTTNRRSYNFKLISSKDKYNAIVKFVYPFVNNDTVKYNDITKIANDTIVNNIKTPDNSVKYNTNYYISYTNKKLYWIPKYVYDDGKKVYIVFNDDILYNDFPVVVDNKKNPINYNVNGNTIIIDNMHTDLFLILNKDKIHVYKK